MNNHKTQLSDIHEDGNDQWSDEENPNNQNTRSTQDNKDSNATSSSNSSSEDVDDIDDEDANSAIVRNARQIREIKARLQTKEKLLTEFENDEDADIPLKRVSQWLDDWQTVTFELEERNKLLQRRMGSQTRRHRGSMVDLHNKMFKKLLDAEEQTIDELAEAKAKINELEKKLELQRMVHDQNEAQRRGSMSTYSDRMFQKLLDAEEQFDKEIKRLNMIIENLKNELQIEKLKNNNDGMTADETSERVSKALVSQMTQLENKNETLKKHINELEQQLRAKNLESESMERQRRGSIKVLSENMMKKLLDAEEEFEQKVNEFEAEIKHLKETLRLEQVKNESLKEKYEQSELGVKIENYKKEIEALHKKNNELADLVSIEQQNNEKLERLRQNSIHNLHNNMFQKLLDAEYEYEEEIEKLNQKIRKLQDRLHLYELGDESDENDNNKNNTSKNTKNETNRKEQNQNNSSSSDGNNQVSNENNGNDNDNDNENDDLPINYSNMKNSVTPMGPEDNPNDNNTNTNDSAVTNNNSTTNDLKNDTNVSTNTSPEKSNKNQNNRQNNNNSSNNSDSVNSIHLENLHNAQKQIIKLEAENTTLHAEIEELKNQLRSMKSKANTIERERRASVTQAAQKIFGMKLAGASEQHTKMEELKDEFNNKELELKQEIHELQTHLEESERNRRESVHVYQKILWKNMGEAEDESNKQVNEVKKELKLYKDEANKLRKENEFLIASKLNLIEECNQQLNLLRKGLSVINRSDEQKSSWRIF